MNISHIAAFFGGVFFFVTGLKLRKQHKKWKMFVFGGVVVVILVILAIALGVTV